MAEIQWQRHQSGIAYRRGNRNGEVLYQIQGSDDWLSEKDFNRRCREVPRSIHQGPLRGPDPYDSRLFPAEGGPREGQTRDPGGNYEVTQRDGRQPQDNPSSGRRGSAYHSDRGAATTLVSSTRVADARVASKLASKPTDSVDRPERTLPAPLSQLSPLARDLVDIGFGKYRESMDFISDNPSILAQNEIDALIAEALTAEKASKSTRSQTCVHQALLLKECIAAGRDNIGPFFRNLAARDSKTKESFVKDVKKVYISIQERAARVPPQNQEPTSGPQGRRLPLVSQPANESVSQNPSTHTQGPKEPTQRQTQGPDGRLYYTDPAGNLLRPDSSQRHDRERHRSQSDPNESAGKMAMLSIEEGFQNAPDTADRRGDQGRPPGRIVPSPAGLLPTVHEDRMTDNRRIVGTSGTEEKLDHRYRIRSDAGGFFGIGRVFALLWHESAGGGGGGAGGRRVRTELSNPIAVTGRFGEEVYSHIRRMVVVKAEHGFCLCLPINTYNGQGVTKPGLSEGDRRAHAIVYMTDTRPFCLPEEEKYLTKKSIAVEKASADQRLDPMSRLNFKKVYTIEHNVKVMNVGKVAKDSLPALLGYWRQSLQD